MFSSVKILLTSASAKFPLYKSLSAALSNDYELIVGDCDKNCLMAHLNLEFVELPKLDVLEIEYLCKFCQEKNIKYIIPTRDGELEYFASNKEFLKSKNINVMISEIESVNTCFDKLKFAQILNLNRINAIQTTLDIEEIDSESLVVKERFGSGSKNIGIGLSRCEAVEYAKTITEPIFQPYISGDEYSVDVYNDRFNEIIGAVVRKRVLVRNGESQVTQIVVDSDIQQCVINAVKMLHLHGHSVAQVIKDVRGQCHIIEINARIGGASTISFKAGLDSLNWFIKECLGEKLKPVKTLENLKMIRVAKDIFYDFGI